jgi:hypothetical protein
MPLDPNEQARDQELELSWEFGPGEDRATPRSFDPSHMTGELQGFLREAAAFRGGRLTAADIEDAEEVFDIDVEQLLAEAKALGIAVP